LYFATALLPAHYIVAGKSEHTGQRWVLELAGDEKVIAAVTVEVVAVAVAGTGEHAADKDRLHCTYLNGKLFRKLPHHTVLI
jgi:hypothetical protein